MKTADWVMLFFGLWLIFGTILTLLFLDQIQADRTRYAHENHVGQGNELGSDMPPKWIAISFIPLALAGGVTYYLHKTWREPHDGKAHT
jgi:hypothetical protein